MARGAGGDGSGQLRGRRWPDGAPRERGSVGAQAPRPEPPPEGGTCWTAPPCGSSSCGESPPCAPPSGPPAAAPACRGAAWPSCARWAGTWSETPAGETGSNIGLSNASFPHGMMGETWKRTAQVEGAEAQTCFASSFKWCQKEQVIDLQEEGFWQDLLDTYQPDIVVSDWWGGRQDCGCQYELCVALLTANKKGEIDAFEVKPDAIPQWNDASYQKVTHTFRRYGPGVRYTF